jgi:hypothetical protein
MRLWKWLGDAWTEGQRNEEATIMGEAAARGAAIAPGTGWALERVRSRRLRLRLFGTLAVIIAVTAFLTLFTSNRVIHGVSVAAVASAAPVALYLGLRRD